MKLLSARVVVPAGLVIAAGVVITLINGYTATLESRFDELRGKYVKCLPRFVADVEALDREPPFPDTARAKNAEPYLRERLSWSASSVTLKHEMLDEFKAKYANWYTKPEVRAQLLADDAFFNKYDSSWMDRILEFDHFDLSTHPVYRTGLEALPSKSGVERISILATLPMPDYSELRSWATFHAFKQARAGRVIEGLKILRHAALLAHSSYNLIGSMTAAYLLNNERAFVEQFKVAGWKPVSKEMTDTYKRVSWAWMMYAKAPWYGEWPKELDAHLHPQTSLCAGVIETVGGPLNLQEWLEPHWPFELDLRAKFAALRERQARLFEICGMKLQAAVLVPPPPEANPWILRGSKRYFRTMASTSAGASDDANNSGFDFNGAKIPYLRRAIGMTLETIAVPNFFRYYDPESK